ncbi:MAG: NAD-dependent isocitrate dehydrogenase [Deltaproteobacteria bacterium]|nr:NAD-dependent isocitrate dehydrogenase [Deltaproteobacteria bacterium]
MKTPVQPPRVVLLEAGPVSEALADAVCAIIRAAGVEIEWQRMAAGVRSVELSGEPMPAEVVQAIRDCGLALKTLLRTPVGGSYESPNVQLRKKLGIFAGVRALRSLPGIESRYRDVDVLLVRELTEDIHAGIEHEIIPGVVQTIKVVTRAKSEQVIRHAFELCRRLGRRKLTLVHKANIMKRSDGMFRAVGRAMAAEFPDIAYDDIIADNAAMQLVARPERFDVLVAGNLFGDILADVGAGLVGAPSLVTSHNTGPGVHVFEATHHVGLVTGDDGKPAATPLTLLMPALDLLRHLGERAVATRITAAVCQVLADSTTVTPDHGGRASTSEMAAAIIAALPAA